MATPPPSPFLRPLGVFESLGAAFRVYFSKANSLFLIVAIFMIPSTIVSTLLIRSSLPPELLNFDANSRENPFIGLSTAEIRQFITVIVLTGILMFVVSMIATGACFRIVQESLAGRPADWQASVRAALAKTLSLIWVPLLVGLLFVGAATLAIVVIGSLGAIQNGLGAIGAIALFGAVVYFFVAWSLAVPVLMAEDQRGWKALKRSRDLVSGSWWPTFGLYLVVFVIVAIVGGLLSAIFAPSGPGEQGVLLAVLGNIVNNIIFTPLQAAIVGVVYLNLASRSPAGMAPGVPGGVLLPPPPPSIGEDV
jgi:hypothetical protein